MNHDIEAAHTPFPAIIVFRTLLGALPEPGLSPLPDGPGSDQQAHFTDEEMDSERKVIGNSWFTECMW